MNARQVAKSQRWLLAIASLAIAAVAVALVSQHVFDMQPCPWCILQRLLYLVVALFALLAAAVPTRAPRVARIVPTVLALAAAGGGVASALYQHFVAANSQSCNLTFADRIVSGLALDHALPPVFQVTASCADAATRVLGVPYEFWSAALFGVLALAALRVVAGQR